MAGLISFPPFDPQFRRLRVSGPPAPAMGDVPAPGDTFAQSVSPPPAPRAGLIARLASAGRSVAMAAVNGVAGLGLFLLGPHHSRGLEERYRQAEQALAEDKAFTRRVGESAFDGLLNLMERPDLPGASAKERLDFILWLTDTNRGSSESSWKRLTQIFTHFQPQGAFVTQANDRGFAHDVSDGRKWYDPEATGFIPDEYHGRIDQGSPQVGHFLTAVDIGRQAAPLEKLLHTAAVGHELVGDDQGALKQTLVGLTHRRERRLFEQAVQAAEVGDRTAAHRWVEQALPDLSDSGQEPGRVGNSRQDLLNTSFGLAFGRLVRSGRLGTKEEAAEWLRRNVGKEASSLPWNDPLPA